MKTYVKICGVTRTRDALMAAALGADAIGLNFYPPSPRNVELERARTIADAVRGRLVLFGVFVGETPERVAEIAATVGLDRLQFHGDEGPELLEAFGRRAVKTLRLSDGPPSKGELARYPDVGGFLFEHRHETLYGGTGRSWDYGSLAQLRLDRPWLLSGGLTAESVGRAIGVSGATGVDACSGVESEPGAKDRDAMRRFILEARGVVAE